MVVASATEAAALLRAVLAALPARTPRDRATARRIEGAALALDTAEREQIRPS